jgi:cytochrome oxidase Cu insertion factor (SCO1/SenC/PrrC family)
MVKPKRSTVRIGLGVAAIALIAIVSSVIGITSPFSSPAGTTLATNPDLDPGTPLSGRAPDFTLTDQFDRRVSLHSFRGKVVILAFNDS